MIGKIWGRVDEIEADSLLLEVSGVGYLVNVSQTALRRLSLGQNICLRIESSKKDEQTIFFGFLDKLEQIMFRYLISVQGVGGKMAMAILSQFAPLEILDIITEKEAKKLQKTNGVGPKLANRIVSELKENKNLYRDALLLRSEFLGYSGDKNAPLTEGKVSSSEQTAAKLEQLFLLNNSAGAKVLNNADPYFELKRDAMSALINLGFTKAQASEAIEATIQSFIHQVEGENAEQSKKNSNISGSENGISAQNKITINLDHLLRAALGYLS